MPHGKGFKLVAGSLPSLHMRHKTIETPKPQPRKEPTPRPVPDTPQRVYHYSLVELQCQAPWITLKHSPEAVIMGVFDDQRGQITKCITVTKDLVATVKFGELPLKTQWSLEQTPLEKLLRLLEGKSKCGGIPDQAVQDVKSNQVYRFVSSKLESGRVVTCSVVRSRDCEGAVDSGIVRCGSCDNVYTVLSCLTKEELIRLVKSSRTDAKNLHQTVKQLEKEIAQKGVDVPSTISEGLVAAMEQLSENTNPLMELFWDQQKQALAKKPQGMRWHPMMIRFAIYVHYQSPRAYQALKATGVLRLPNESTLRDYTNVLQPKEGFQVQSFNN